MIIMKHLSTCVLNVLVDLEKEQATNHLDAREACNLRKFERPKGLSCF